MIKETSSRTIFIQDHPDRNGNGSNEIFAVGREMYDSKYGRDKGEYMAKVEWVGGNGRKSLGGKVRWRESVLR